MLSRWHLRDLVTDHLTGKLRETVMWSNIGKAVMTFSFIFLTLKGQLTEWYVMAYGGIVIFHELGSRVLTQRQRQMDKESPPPPTDPNGR